MSDHFVTRIAQITVPIVPPATLLPNMRRRGKGGASHWTQAADTAMVRQAAKMASRDATPITGPVSVTYEIHWPEDRYKGKHRMPDTDSLPTACKAILDGIVDAGILPDDSPEIVTFIGASQTKETRRGCVVVRITEVKA